jgi:putative peptide zinc metalloprotease protein|tara:strand:- start:4161 stop:5306 length:1146 start_codon:yes stop_codon:yes gene_type:complete
MKHSKAHINIDCQWLDSVELFSTDNKSFLSYDKKTFLIDYNTTKIVSAFQSNNLDFKQSIKFLNHSFFNDNLSELELKSYLDNMNERIVNSIVKPSGLAKILVLGNPSKTERLNFLTKLFVGSYKKMLIAIAIIFLLNTLFYIYYINATPLIVSIPSYISSSIYVLGFIILIFWHELGHIIAAKSLKLKIPEIGVGIFFIFPVLYVDLNNIWILSKEKRVIINLGGVYFQSLLGIIFILLFELFNYEIFRTLFSINFFIIIINLIPIFKLDGYWLISDLSSVLNLDKRSNELLKSIFTLKIKEFKKYSFFVFSYTLCKLVFYVFLVFIMITPITYFFLNFSVELVTQIVTSPYFITIASLITLKYILYYGKRIFNTKKQIT